MKKYETNSWVAEDELCRTIGQVPYPEPATDIVGRIMASLKPYKPSIGRRLMIWFKEPVTFRISPALAGLTMLLFLLPGGYSVFHLYSNPATRTVGIGKAGATPVVFNYKSKDVKSVAVMGSFNHFNLRLQRRLRP